MKQYATKGIILSVLLALGVSGMAQEKPASRESLFGDDLPPAKPKAVSPEKPRNTDDPARPALPLTQAFPEPEKPRETDGKLRGSLQLELARTVADPDHWSKMRLRADLGSSGRFANGVKWKLGARLDYDAAYDRNFYPNAVQQDQRHEATLRENYLDINADNWDFRLGRQHVVWGEMVGLFFADVVSARDLREFILPDFESLRIPQWAARAEYFGNDMHAELLWIPVASYDRIGKAGAEFYPYQPIPAGATAIYRSQKQPGRSLDTMNYGVRLSALRSGWDVSGFLYSSMNISPTFYRQTINPMTFVFTPRHDRIHQLGGTLSKDFGSVVLKTEAVYSQGRRFTVLRADPDGVVRQNTLDWAAGLDFTLATDTRFNVQLFQRVFFDHDRDIVPDKRENGFSLYLSSKFGNNWEAQALLISSLNRSDWMFRPKLSWNFERNWRLLLGADIFHGPTLGLFGQYDNKDRVYSEIRYSF